MSSSLARLLVLLATLALGACGGDGASTGTPTSAPPETAAAGVDPVGPPPVGEAPSGGAAPGPGAELAGSGADHATADGTTSAGSASASATICERAHACCAAYVEAIPSARRPLEQRACAEIDRVIGEAGEATDEACEAAIGGWRQSLQLTGIEVPAACLD